MTELISIALILIAFAVYAYKKKSNKRWKSERKIDFKEK